MQKQNQYYWAERNKMSEKAKKHAEKMEKFFSSDIKESIRQTKIYDETVFEPVQENKQGTITMKVVENGTVETLINEDLAGNLNGKTALLNFASYKEPGGRFLQGSKAQEECLCHASTLYNVLKEFEESYYLLNRQDLNRGLYRDKALYSPDIIFGVRVVDSQTKKPSCIQAKCDVITCASPNFSVAERFVKRSENNNVLKERIKFILNIAKQQGVKNLILGAYGCGVFRQDPDVVAQLFIKESEKIFKDYDINIIFAVIPPLPNQTDNSTPFMKAVEEWNRNH